MRRPNLLHDPVDAVLAEQASTSQAFEALFRHLVTTPSRTLGTAGASRGSLPHHGRRYVIAGVAALAVFGTVLPIALTSGAGGLTRTTTTPVYTPTPFAPSAASDRRARSGQWQLLGAILSGDWTQNTDGPPAGSLACASGDACYVLAGTYASPDASAPLLSESIYATDDLGSTWNVAPMPAGFAATSQLSCPTPSHCDVGGTLDRQSVFLSTVDGGGRWTMTPLATSSAVLVDLSCPSPEDCSGVVGPTWAEQVGLAAPADAAPDESYVTTDDGGSTWKARPLPGSDLALDLECSAIDHCVLIGAAWGPAGALFDPAAFVRVTSNGGTSWANGRLPEGFSINGDFSGLSCSDSTNCFVSGLIPITIADPPECSTADSPSASSPPSRPAGATLPPMSPAVAAISKTESSIASRAAAQEATDGGAFSCASDEVQPVSAIASSTDGGRSWAVDQLPANVPDPQLTGISCPTSSECWASGSELVLERAGRTTDADSPVLLGTTDGGGTWSKVVFTAPSNAPDAYGQSYLSMGRIDCPTTHACIALGTTARSSPTSPVYSMVSGPTP